MDNSQENYINIPVLGNNNDDEIIIRDTEGNIKIWQHGGWRNLPDVEEKISIPQADLTYKDKQKLKILDTGLEGPFLGPLKPALKDFPKSEGFIKKDEKRIEDLYQKKESKPPPLKQKNYGINKIVDKVNEVLALRLNLELKKRLKNILFSYCRHARSMIDSLEILQRSKDDGGMEFKLTIAEQVMNVVRNILERIEREGGIVVDEDRFFSLEAKPAPPLEKQQLKVSPSITSTKEEPKTIDLSFKTSPSWEINSVKEEPVFIKPKLIKRTPSEESKFPQVVRPISPKIKQITEVRKRPVILGPVEGLASFTLLDFRRIDEDTQVRVEKILKKINVLAEDSLTKKAEGIKAWRQSEVYQYYLNIGEESIRRGISIKQLIDEKMKNNEETLKMEEFEALSDLNQKLRF